MNKKTFIIIVAAILVFSIIGGGFLVIKSRNNTAAATETEAAASEKVETKVEEEKQTAEIMGYKLEETTENAFYVKSGDLFYPAVLGETNIEEKDLIAKKVDEKRVVSFCSSQNIIPTLYKDDQLVYRTTGFVPSFIWERFHDNGYSFGMFGMQMAESGNVEFVLGASKTNHMSTAYEKLSVLALDDASIFIDKVSDQKVKAGNLSNGGSIIELKKDVEYNVDLYVGTVFHRIKLTADTQILNAMDVFETKEFSLYQEGYASVTIPDDLPSGYYMINGVGVFRYVNGNRENGYENVDFNTVPEIEDK